METGESFVSARLSLDTDVWKGKMLFRLYIHTYILGSLLRILVRSRGGFGRKGLRLLCTFSEESVVIVVHGGGGFRAEVVEVRLTVQARSAGEKGQLLRTFPIL